MSAKPQQPVETVFLTTPCSCGKKHGAHMKHYQLLRASCGRFFWALQPRRNGPLVLFPHPGFIIPQQ